MTNDVENCDQICDQCDQKCDFGSSSRLSQILVVSA